MGAGGIVLIIVVILAVIGIAWLLFWWLYERASKEMSFVRTGLGGEKVVMSSGAFVLPVLHNTTPVNMKTVLLDLERGDEHALITRDRMRVNVTAEFFVRVRPNAEAIAAAAQTLGSRTLEAEQIRPLLEGKFVDALRAVAAERDMQQLHEQRIDFVRTVREALAGEIEHNGLELESISLTGLDQASREHFNPNNAFDAEGLTKLTAEIETRRRARNEIEQDAEVAIQEKNLEAERLKLEIAKQEEHARLQQQKEIALRRAQQKSEIAAGEAERDRHVEESRVNAREQIELTQLTSERIVSEARLDSEQKVREHEIARDATIELARFERDISVAERSKDQSRAQAEAEEARSEAVRASETVTTVREVERAERQKAIELVAARQEAERSAVDVVVSAEARRQAAIEQAETSQIQTESEANRVRLLALAETEAEKQRAEAADVRNAVEAKAQRAMHEADTALTPALIELKVKMAIIERLQEIIGETVKPLENIEGIKIVHVDGLGAGSGGSRGEGSGPGNYAEQLTDSALRYRAQAPIVDALLKGDRHAGRGSGPPRGRAGSPVQSARRRGRLTRPGGGDMTIDARLATLGITLPPPLAPLGAYVGAVVAGNLVFVAGHGPRREDGSYPSGKVPADVSVEEAVEAARLVGLNVLSSLEAAIGDLDRVERFVKVLGMVNAEPDFRQHPKVLDGFSNLMIDIFGEPGRCAALRGRHGLAAEPDTGRDRSGRRSQELTAGRHCCRARMRGY